MDFIWYFLAAFLVFDVFLVMFILLKRRKSGGMLSASEKKYLLRNWRSVVAMYRSKDYKHAILDADKLLDYALKKNGFHGSVGEMLKKSSSGFSDLDGVWSAHKLRNRVAHEIFDLKKVMAKPALRSFKKALNDLGAEIKL